MISIVNTECHVPKTFSDLAKIAAWGRLGLDKRGAAFRSLGRGDGEHQGAAFQFDIAEHRGAVRHRLPPRHAPGAFRFSVRFLAQPVPQVRGFPLKRRDSIKRSEEHTSELQSLMRTPYAVFCLNKKTK